MMTYQIFNHEAHEGWQFVHQGFFFVCFVCFVSFVIQDLRIANG